MQATSQIPSDVVSEKAVLGVLLCSGAETLAEACAIIVPEDFFDPVNSLIFEHLRKMLNSGLPVELTSVAAEFRRCDLMRKIAPDQSDRGGAEFLCELVDGYGFDKANMRYYCRVIREKRQLRALIQLGQRMTAEAKAPMADADELLEHFGTDLYRLSVCEGDSALPKPIGVAVDAAILRADDIAAGRQSPGLMTGFKAIDVAMGGMQPGDLVVVAGPTSVGKTAYALTVVARAAKAGKAVLYISAEMTAESLANRILQGETRIAGHNIRTGNLDGIQVQERDCVRQMVASWKFSICASSMTVGQIATRARIFAAQLGQPLDLICVDYLQLMKPDGGDTRAQEVSQIAWSLKTLAMELGVPVMALSQLNRAGVVNPDEPPELHNLKESGDIENHANSVILLHRSKKAALDTAGAVPIWCRIAKCRDGLTTPWPAPAGKDHIPGSITLRFRPEWTRYE